MVEMIEKIYRLLLLRSGWSRSSSSSLNQSTGSFYDVAFQDHWSTGSSGVWGRVGTLSLAFLWTFGCGDGGEGVARGGAVGAFELGNVFE